MTELTKVVQEAMEQILGDNPEAETSDLQEMTRRLGCKFDWGATRWALIFPKERVVYKFRRHTKEDYCAYEAENYALAKQYRVERCLLEVRHAFTLSNGLKVYSQQMFSTSFDLLSRPQRNLNQKKMRNLAKKDLDIWGNLDWKPIISKIGESCKYYPPHQWVARAIHIYGKAFMKNFAKWTHEAGVNDLHGANVGFYKKQPIIIDYAGYRTRNNSRSSF